jgi:hypothetical protein
LGLRKIRHPTPQPRCLKEEGGLTSTGSVPADLTNGHLTGPQSFLRNQWKKDPNGRRFDPKIGLSAVTNNDPELAKSRDHPLFFTIRVFNCLARLKFVLRTCRRLLCPPASIPNVLSAGLRLREHYILSPGGFCFNDKLPGLQTETDSARRR